ncbi:protein SHQ1 homolog [Tachysurus ichikawai]
MDLHCSAGGGSTVAFRSKHMVALAEALRKAELHKNDMDLELQILEEAAELVVEEEREEGIKKGQQEQTNQCEDESSSSSEGEEKYSSSEDHDNKSEEEEEEEEEQKGVPDGLAMTCPCSQELKHGESLIRELGERLEEELRIRKDVPQITVQSSSTAREEKGEVERLRKTDDSQFPEAQDGIKIAKAASDTDLVEHRRCNVRILNTEELDSDDEDESQPIQ